MNSRIKQASFTPSRSYGGYHRTKRAAYPDGCRQLLGFADNAPLSTDDRLDDAKPSGPMCPRCEVVMECLSQQSRPSWEKVLERGIYGDPSIYSPMHHIHAPPSTFTRSRNMDSNVKRPGWEICGQTEHGTSNLLKGPYRPRSQQMAGRFLDFFGRPHQAGAPPVCADRAHRATYARQWRTSGLFFCDPNPSSLHPCLTRVADIG